MGEGDIHILTEEEKKLIVQLRENVKDELPKSFLKRSDEDQDFYLVRWIRARDNNIQNATKMLSNSLKWREEKKADDIVQTLKLSPFYQENFPFRYAGLDKQDHPIFLIPLSAWDFRKVVSSDPEKLKEFDDFVTFLFEDVSRKIEESLRKNKETGGSLVSQVLVLVDVKNYPYGQLINFGAIKKLLQLASTYEAHYPEILFKGVFINCPSYFNLFMALIKPVLAPKTYAKIFLYSQMKDWEKDLEELVDASILPKKYGGTAEDLVD